MGVENVIEPVGESSFGKVYKFTGQEKRSATAAEKGCVAAWRGGDKIQTPGGLAVSSPGGKVTSPASSDDRSGISFQNAESNISDSQAVSYSLIEEFPGFGNADEVKHTGSQTLDGLENDSCTVEGALMIGQNNEALAYVLLPIKRCSQGSQNSSRDQDIITSNQSLRILSNLVAAGAITSSGLLDEIRHEILVYTTFIVRIKSSELNELRASELNELRAKSFSIIKVLLDNVEHDIGGSYFRHRVALADIFSQVGVFACSERGTLLGVLPYNGGLIAYSDCRVTYTYASGLEEVVDTNDKCTTISDKSNIYYLKCGDGKSCGFLADTLVKTVLQVEERTKEWVYIDTIVKIVEIHLEGFVKKHGLRDDHVHGGIFIGLARDNTYRAVSILLDDSIHVVWLTRDFEATTNVGGSYITQMAGRAFKAIKEIFVPEKFKERLLLGSGTPYVEAELPWRAGDHLKSREIAITSALSASHCASLFEPSVGGATIVRVFKHGERHHPMDFETYTAVVVQLNNQKCLDRLLLVKIHQNDVKIGTPDQNSPEFSTEFETNLSDRYKSDVVLASFFFAKGEYRYYRILTTKNANYFFEELKRRFVEEDGLFSSVDYRFKDDIRLGVALCAPDVLHSI